MVLPQWPIQSGRRVSSAAALGSCRQKAAGVGTTTNVFLRRAFNNGDAHTLDTALYPFASMCLASTVHPEAMTFLLASRLALVPKVDDEARGQLRRARCRTDGVRDEQAACCATAHPPYPVVVGGGSKTGTGSLPVRRSAQARGQPPTAPSPRHSRVRSPPTHALTRSAVSTRHGRSHAWAEAEAATRRLSASMPGHKGNHLVHNKYW
jgi:hypothetical protein